MFKAMWMFVLSFKMVVLHALPLLLSVMGLAGARLMAIPAVLFT